MADFLQAIGRGEPVKAFSESYEGIANIIERPERMREQKEERALRIEGLGLQRAVSEETLAKSKSERQELERIQKFQNEPDNINKYIDQLGLLPEAKSAFTTHMRGYGVDEFGGGRRGDILKGTQDFFKSPMGINALRMQANYAEQTYKGLSKKVREITQTGEGVEKLPDLQTKLALAEKELMKWSTAYSQTVELQENITDLQGQINSMVNSGEWGKFPIELRQELEAAKGEGNRDAFRKALQKQRELEGKEGKGANIHYETDNEGNTIKIVSHPITGETIRKENMGKIGRAKEEKERTFKDKMIEKIWPGLSPDEQKRILGARIDPHELTEKNILDVYGNFMTDPAVRKALQPIAEEIIKKATIKPSEPSGETIDKLPANAKFIGYGEDGKKIYMIPPSKSGDKPKYIKER